IPMQAVGAHNDHGSPVVLLDATVAVPGAAGAAGVAHAAAGPVPASVSVVSGATTLATRTRSRHIPVVKVLSPRAGATVGRGRTVTVAYSARDADHDPLTAKVEYSRDDGQTFTTLWTGPAGRTAKLSSAQLAGSSRARIRVRVSDGFNEGRA